MMMFSCWLYMTLIEKDAEVELSRHVSLPFPPFKGLELDFYEGEGDENEGDSFEVDRIEFCVPTGGFHLYGTSDLCSSCPCTPEQKCCVFNRATYESWGWTVDKVKTGYERFHEREWIFEPDKTYWTKLKELKKSRSQTLDHPS